MGIGANDRSGALTAVLIAPNRGLADEFYRAQDGTHAFQVLADLKTYPSEQTLEIRLRQLQPAVVLVDASQDLEAACGIVRLLASHNPPVPAAVLDVESRHETVMRLLRLGASEFLAAPFEAGALEEAAAAIGRQRQPEPEAEKPSGKVIVFCSAKPGAGASVVASQIAFALGRLTTGRILLADLDGTGGTVGFYTRQEHGHSFLDALEQAGKAGLAVWTSLPVSHRGVDILPAPAAPREIPVEPAGLRQTLDEARRAYEWSVLDLPVIFHRASLTALAEADQVFLVTTTELTSLHLARRAVRMLDELGIRGGRLEVVVREVETHERVSGSDLGQILGCQRHCPVPDDHPALHEAIALGEPVKPGSGLGNAIEQLAARLAGVARDENERPGPMLHARPAYAHT